MKPRLVLASLAIATMLGCASVDTITPASTSVWLVTGHEYRKLVKGVRWIRQDANTVAFLDSSRSVIAEYRIGAIVGFTSYPNGFIPDPEPTAPGLDDILGNKPK